MIEQQIRFSQPSAAAGGRPSRFVKAFYALRAKYRQIRIQQKTTSLLGPQYRRSRDMIEIDITYVCNLRCLNCNRSVSQAPDKMHMSLATVKQFVDESIARGKRWKRIRVLGGEPTLHPQFLQIVDSLRIYRYWHPGCVIEVVSNGHGRAVRGILQKIPSDIRVENTAKTGNVQPAFGAFNLAPVDDEAFRSADFRNGCDIMEECGMGLTPLGYYQCAVAGGIDRIAGKKLGYASLPADDDEMFKLSDELCRLCGHFRDGHCAPQNVRPVVTTQENSVTWTALYAKHKKSKKIGEPVTETLLTESAG